MFVLVSNVYWYYPIYSLYMAITGLFTMKLLLPQCYITYLARASALSDH